MQHSFDRFMILLVTVTPRLLQRNYRFRSDFNLLNETKIVQILTKFIKSPAPVKLKAQERQTTFISARTRSTGCHNKHGKIKYLRQFLRHKKVRPLSEKLVTLCIKYQNSKTTFKSSLNSHVFWETLYIIIINSRNLLL